MQPSSKRRKIVWLHCKKRATVAMGTAFASVLFMWALGPAVQIFFYCFQSTECAWFVGRNKPDSDRNILWTAVLKMYAQNRMRTRRSYLNGEVHINVVAYRVHVWTKFSSGEFFYIVSQWLWSSAPQDNSEKGRFHGIWFRTLLQLYVTKSFVKWREMGENFVK